MSIFEGLKKIGSIEIDGKAFYFKQASMLDIKAIQSIKDGEEVGKELIFRTICNEDGSKIEGLTKDQIDSELPPTYFMEMAQFVQELSMPSAEKKS
jgi:hypothetical protein